MKITHMIPYILAVAGGYLLGNTEQTKKFNAGGITDKTFVQPLKDRYPYGSDVYVSGGIYSELGLDTNDKNFNVYFDLIPDIKSYGYRGIDFKLIRIVGQFSWYVEYDEVTEVDIQRLLDMGGSESKTSFVHHIVGVTTLDTFGFDWKIDTRELKFSPSGSFIISEMEINYTGKEITLK
jgi:hypothetical protein